MRRIPLHTIPLLPLILLACLASPGTLLAQSAWYEGFEKMEPSWENLGGDGRFQIRHHERTPQVRLTGERSEWVSVLGEGGTYVYMAHNVGKPRIIDELGVTVQVRADRPGIQLLAEVTLPRSRHPQTGKLLTTLVRGTSYTDVGKWQQLRIDDLPRLLTRQTQILRAEHSTTIDPREAYISRVVLNVYGGPGTTNVWIDDLDISGYVEAGPLTVSNPPTQQPPPSSPAVSGQWQGAGISPQDDGSQRRVRLDRSVLLVDGTRFFVRAVRWRGEPLTVLKILGFNTIWLDRFPSPDLLADAERTGLWLISPPPQLPQQQPLQNGSPQTVVFGSEYRSILAWDLGAGLDDRHLDFVRPWAKQLRTADSRFRRPLIARPESNLREYSRIADILVIGRPVLGSSLQFDDYIQWLRLRPNLARPGTPVWVVVPTGPEPALLAQWEAMSPGGSPATGFSSEQLRLITYASCAGGARGLLFESHTPMDSTEPTGDARRTTLELLNLELTLAEPWFAGGDITAMGECRTSQDITVPVFRAKRAQLVIPIWTGPGAAQVPGLDPQRSMSAIVPGALEADDAHELLPGRLRRIQAVRAAGGTRVTIDRFDLTSQVLLTQDPSAFTNCSRRVQASGRRMAELQRRLAELKTEQFERLVVPLTLNAPNTREFKALEAELPVLRRMARESLLKCDEALTRRDYAAAYAESDEAMRPFRLLERRHWLAASQSVPGVSTSPMLATFATLPDHWTLLRGISRSVPGGNLLPAGDFENLQVWQNSGWEHLQYRAPGVAADAELVADAARSGNLGLRLIVTPSEAGKPPQLVESPPVWISSAPVHLESRSLVAIRGWVRIHQSIQGAADGLLVFDSLAGKALAERIQAGDQWQEFVLYRVAPQSGPVRVTFAMSGMGTADIDDVTIQTLTASPTPVASQGGYGTTMPR